ncbi:MAG: hypothetical protein RR714_00275 [Aurantimicrobium sp.]
MSLLAVAGVLIAIQIFQIVSGSKVDQVIAWAAIILILLDLFISRMNSTKSKQSED